MFNKLIKFDSIAFPLAIERVEMSVGAGIMRITFLFFILIFGMVRIERWRKWQLEHYYT